MLRIYYYLFYRLYTFAKWVHVKDAIWTGMLLIMALTYLNFMTIFACFLDMGKIISFLGSEIFAIITMVPLGLINYFVLLNKDKSNKIIALFEQESKSQKVTSSILTVMYVIVTLVLAHR